MSNFCVYYLLLRCMCIYSIKSILTNTVCAERMRKLHFPKLFLAMESLVSDIPAGDGKIANLFYSVGRFSP
jgi:hypothetical protein